MALPKYRSMDEVPFTVKRSHKFILGGLLLALVCLFEMHYDILVESYNTKTKSFRDVISIFKSSTAEDEDIIDHQLDRRKKYGYLHPTPPYKPVIRTSHTCNISKTKNNETIQEVVHLPVATPHLILIGAQKSGTSSFQSMIDKRINVITPLSVNKFEPHFFDFRVRSVLKKYTNTDHTSMEYKSKVCQKRKQYTEYFNMTKIILNNESVAIEKTPSYILYSNLPWMIDDVCPWAKIAVILRSPVDRAWSGYRMSLSRGKNKKNVTDFSTFVKEEIDEFIKYGLLNNSTQSLDEFEASLNHTANTTTLEDEVDRLASSSPFVFPANMTLDTYAQLVYNYDGKRGGLLFRGLYAPLLIPWVQQFAADDRLMILRFSDLYSKPNETVDEVLGFAGVNDTSIDEDYIIPKRIRKNPDMKGKDISLDPTLRLYLNLLYRPINKLLAELLGDDWQGVWA